MVKVSQTVIVLLGVWVVAQPFVVTPVEADASDLSPFFYLKTCPDVFHIVAKGVFDAMKQETRNAASLLRLHFHDCFVQGCDGSILLDGTPTNPSEKIAPPNLNSVRGFQFIDSIKASLEDSCPGVVSCADVVTLAAFFSVVLSGGPVWWVPLGRRDSFLANLNETVQLVSPFESITSAKKKFADQKLTVTDLVALQGSHTIGLARCAVVTPRIYNFNSTLSTDPTLNKTRLQTLRENCPNGGDGNVTNPMDISTPTVFDNLYYKNLILSNGLFETDQELFDAASDTNALVKLYASDQHAFFDDFASGMISMGNLNVLTGSNGEIRQNCHVRNPHSVNLEQKRRNEKTRGDEVTYTADENESPREFFKRVVKKAVEEIMGEELERLVEDAVRETVSGGHSSM